MSEDRSLLEGLKVVEMATFVLAPAAGTVMADHGADVVKVEPCGIGDPYRMLYRFAPLPPCEVNYPWLHTNRNKRSLAVDLKQDEGREIVLALAREADVFLTNYHPSVLAALRLRYEDVQPVNPRLIYGHATGYGERGDEIERPGYDATAYWARSGLMEAVRDGAADPGVPVAAMGDHPSSIALFGAVMLALYERERSGRGRKATTSLIANGAWANATYIQAALCGAPPYRPYSRDEYPNAMGCIYMTADGRRLLLLLIKGAEEFGHFCEVIERPELADDPRFAEVPERRANARELIAIMDDVFAQRPLAEWQSLFDANAITYGVLSLTEELADDPQFLANDVLVPLAADGAERTVTSPIEVSGAPKRPAGPAPELGQHTDEVLGELGYDDAARAQLRERGVVAGTPVAA